MHVKQRLHFYILLPRGPDVNERGIERLFAGLWTSLAALRRTSRLMEKPRSTGKASQPSTPITSPSESAQLWGRVRPVNPLVCDALQPRIKSLDLDSSQQLRQRRGPACCLSVSPLRPTFSSARVSPH
ncbi:hypothetical protein DPEC_G00045010 [Dallia pectoralis]|uniref:Uncharacterized protein n=1 Tax=Dallia pectoralis TaxID=75939 RepID=A0ACC2HA30_DALPE|nr:hypothetical protein DPEC_G00045010 [Dallia pectoralis]